jgi:2-isopropylmalate synthase
MNTNGHSAKPFFYDITLRDGNQALVKPWNTQEKEQVFRQLLKLGVQGIEVGFAGASDMDFEACEHLAKLTAQMAQQGDVAAQNVVISGLARAVRSDIQKVWDAVQYAPNPRIHTFIATSPLSMEHVLKMSPEQVKQKAGEAVAYACEIMGDKANVQFSAEHFGDCGENLDFVLEVIQTVVKAGATTINLPNTVERYRPMLFVQMVQKVVESLPPHVKVAVHTHNDLGMATATTVESYFAGAVQMETALNGLGERAGNTNMYEVAMALHNCGVEVPLHLEHVYETALLMAKWSGVAIPEKAPLIGPEAVAHRSGIHQDGASKTKNMSKGAYRPIDFSIIGRDSNDVITFTSQSGKTAVYEMLTNCGYSITLEEAGLLQPILKDISEREGELDENRVLEIFRKKMVNVHGRLVFSSINGMRDENSFQFRFKLDGQMRSVDVSAEGPIEASLLLLREEGFPVELVSYKQSVVSVKDSMWSGRALSEIELRSKGKTVIGRGVHNDTLMANMMAVFGGVNLLFA